MDQPIIFPTLTLTDTVYLKSQLIRPHKAQVALAGRSNVGKSSLVNTLAGRKALARISATPGKTRSLNFYDVAPDGYILVDLPGYGYAKCSKTEREKWRDLVSAFFQGNTGLAAVAAILDCRLPPQKLDLELLAYVRDLGLPTLLVLTKADKCTQRDREARRRQWRDLHPESGRPLLFSARTGLGREALRQALALAAHGGEAEGEGTEEEDRKTTS